MKYLFIITLILTGFLAPQVNTVEAISWQNQLTSCDMTGCHSVPYYNVTVNTDKANYAPGENIQLSSFMQTLFCSNAAAIYSLDASVGSDYVSLVTMSVVDGGGSVHYSSGNLTAPTNPGNYDISLSSCHFGWGMECATVSTQITVTGTTPPPPPPTPAAIISGTNCKIPQGNTTCTGTLSWLISGASNPNVYNNNGTTYSSNVSGTNVPAVLGYGLNTVYARDGGTPHATANIVTECEDGFSWVDGKCGIPSTPSLPPPDIKISVAKDLIRSGETTVATTEITAPYRTTCTLYGVSSGPINFTHEGNINPTRTYNHTTRPLTAAQVVTVTCQPSPAINGVGSATRDARIEVIPTVQEI